MKRLTVKTNDGYALPLHFEGETTERLEEIINAYGEIEDYSEELGVDLRVILKAQKVGIKVKTKYGIKHYSNQEIFFNLDTQDIVWVGVHGWEDKYENYYERNDWEIIANTNGYKETWVLEDEEF